MSLQTEEYEKDSPFLWAVNNIKLPKGQKWDFTHRAWQIPIFDDKSKQIVIIKSTQMGITLIMTCRALHFAAFNTARVMYTLPRQDDVTDIVTSRLMETIEGSPKLLTLLGNIDNVRLKKFGSSYLHFMESSVTPRMLDVDYLINDEVDMSNQDNLDQYVARLDASEFQLHHKLSTPTIHGFGIDREYSRSDMKVWLVKCPRCGLHQEIDWFKNVRTKGERAWYVCEKCDRNLTPEIIQNGEWVPQYRDRSISGYAITQLMSTYISPTHLIQQQKDMSEKNFTNLRLGKPYNPTTGNLSRKEIFSNCFTSGHKQERSGSGYFLGADQGDDIYVAIGKYEQDKLKIVHLETIPLEQGFDRLGRLIHNYGIRCAVIDGLPNKHSAMGLASQFAFRKVLLAFYYSVGHYFREDRVEPRVTIDKTDSYDALKTKISNGFVQFYGSRSSMSSEVRTAIKHLANMRRDEAERSSRTGGIRIESIWTNTGPDHFADAINYLCVATELKGRKGLSAIEINASPMVQDREKEPLSINPYARRIRRGTHRDRRRIAI